MKKIFLIFAIFYFAFSCETKADTSCTYDSNSKTLTVSGVGTFSSCSELDNNKSSIKSIVIDNTVTGIGNSAFYGMKGVTSLTIPDSVTSIGNYAFDCMRGVTSLTIPDSVTSIGEGAFHGMSGVTGELKIPNGITNIGAWTFSGMRGVTGELKIPEGVTSIGSVAFQSMKGVTSLTIPDTVTSIGKGAFDGMSSVTSLTIPDSVTSIGSHVFQGMTNLHELVISGDLDISTLEKNGFFKVPAGLKITCIGITEQKCREKMAYYMPDANGTCLAANGDNKRCLRNPVFAMATETQCKATKKYGWDGTSCVKKDSEGKVSCASGFVSWNNECLDEYPFAKKRWTPAEAAKWLHDGNDNFVVLTFKK